MNKVLLLVVIAAAVAAAVPVPFTDCGGANPAWKIESIEAPYWPPRKGQDFVQTSKFTARSTVDAGCFQIDTSLNGIAVDTTKGDFCQFGDVKCPTAVGEQTIINQGVFPASAPSGAYRMRTLVKNNDTAGVVFCYFLNFNI